MRKASLGTLFLTVFLDLLGFGLVVPFLPGVARQLGASNFVATVLAAAFSLMQFLFVPLWGRLSDRYGRRPILLVSIAASAVGMMLLGFANSLAWLLVARLWSGIATANIAVAQAYIADVTTPENRARGMGLIGMGFGLGFILGPAIGGVLGGYEIAGRPGALAAYFAAALSLVNLVMCFLFVPESLPPEARSGPSKGRRSPLDLGALRKVAQAEGAGTTLLLWFLVTFFFVGLETTFRLYTEDGFGLSVAGTAAVFTFVGLVAAIVQGGLIGKLSRRFGEVALIRAGSLLLGCGFLGMTLAPSAGRAGLVVVFAAAGLIAFGSGLQNPSLSSYASRRAPAAEQGLVLGVLQSLGALARAVGPFAAGALYQYIGLRGPYAVGAVGFLLAFGFAWRLLPLTSAPPAPPPGTASPAPQ